MNAGTSFDLTGFMWSLNCKLKNKNENRNVRNNSNAKIRKKNQRNNGGKASKPVTVTCFMANARAKELILSWGGSLTLKIHANLYCAKAQKLSSKDTKEQPQCS